MTQPGREGPAAVLAGVRVLDFTWVGAGPLATKVLADFGADVIKVESRLRPDPLRRTPPLAPGDDDLERSGYFANRNAGKRSIALDMSHPRARDVVLRLAAHSDVCAQSFRPGTLEKWGLGYDELRSARPDLVYLSMPMQGETGPHAGFSGFGATLVALCGLHDLCGYPDRPPVGTGTNYPDHVPNPMHAALAVLAALLHRRRTGLGQRIELSQLESTLNVIGPAIERAATGGTIGRQGNRVPYACPHGVFPVAGDDRWIAVAVVTPDHWRALVDVLDLAGPVRSRPWSTVVERKADEDAVEAAVAGRTSRYDGPELAARLRLAGVPAAPVRTAADVLDGDNELARRGAFAWLDHPVMGRSVYNAPTPRLSRTPGHLRGPAPLLGAHTRAVCRDVLGMDDGEYGELLRSGALT